MRHAWLVVLVAVVAAGCSRCSKTPEAARARPERYLGKDLVGAVVVPSGQQLGDRLRLLEELKAATFVAQLQGTDSARAFGDALVAELGVDVRSAQEMEKAGLDPAGGLAVGLLASADAYLVLPVKDQGRLENTLKSLAEKRLGATVAGEVAAGTLKVKTFSVAAGQPPRLGSVAVPGFALVAATPGGIARLGTVAVLAEKDSLLRDEALTTALAAMPTERDVWAYVPPGSPAIARTPFASALVTASLSRKTLAVDAMAKWRGQPVELGALTRLNGADLTGLLPKDAFLTLRFSGEARALKGVLPELWGPQLTRAFKEGGLDVDAEVLSQLQPGAVASLSLSPRPPLSRGLPSLDLRRTNPFAYVHLAGAGAVKNKDTIGPTLEKVAALAPRFGAQMKKLDREGHTVFATSYSEGEGVHFAQKDDRVVFGSPLDRVDALLAADGKGSRPVSGLSDDAVAMALDLSRLTAAVRSLPDDAWGLGGFAMKASTVRWLDAVKDVERLSLGASAQGQQVRVSLKVSLALGDGSPR